MKPIYYLINTALIALTISLLSCQPKSKISAPSYKAPNFSSIEKFEQSKSLIEKYYYYTQGSFICSDKGRDALVYNTLPIFTERWGEYWLYAEGAMTTLLDEPYDQAVIKITKRSRDSLNVDFYRIKDKERFILGWYDTQKLKEITLDDLVQQNDTYCNGIAVQAGTTILKLQDKGLCKNEEGHSVRSFSRTTTTFDVVGMCIQSDWYDENRNFGQAMPPDSCALFYRDLKYKYHKVVYEKRLKEYKEEKKRSKY